MEKGPWKSSSFFSGVSGKDDNVGIIKTAAGKRAIEIGADVNNYINGSVFSGLLDVG